MSAQLSKPTPRDIGRSVSSRPSPRDLDYQWVSPTDPPVPTVPYKETTPTGRSTSSLSDLTEDERKQLLELSASSVPVTFSAAMLRAMGRRTKSMSRKGGSADRLFNTVGTAVPFYRNPKVDNRPYRVMQMTTQSVFLAQSAAVFTQAVKNFQLSDIDQATQLAAVFDQYRLARVECWLLPRVTVTTQATGTSMGQVATVVDYDDSNTLTNFASYLDYQNVMVAPGNEGHYRSFTPHVAVAAYSGTFASFENVTAPWLDCASPNVQHYGFKAGSTVADAAYSIDLDVRYHFEFRNVR
jgi:hypothetical protein